MDYLNNPMFKDIIPSIINYLDPQSILNLNTTCKIQNKYLNKVQRALLIKRLQLADKLRQIDRKTIEITDQNKNINQRDKLLITPFINADRVTLRIDHYYNCVAHVNVPISFDLPEILRSKEPIVYSIRRIVGGCTKYILIHITGATISFQCVYQQFSMDNESVENVRVAYNLALC